jgi:hypothetical protein
VPYRRAVWHRGGHPGQKRGGTAGHSAGKAVPLLTALEGWLREKQKTLSRHSELSKAFAYALNQWDALKLYLREITDTEHAGNVPPLTQ